jgi:hypothetical protein
MVDFECAPAGVAAFCGRLARVAAGMASLDSLTEDQRAVLQLLLARGKSYDDLAGLLKKDPAGVRARARSAVAALGPDAGDIGTDHRDEIADYLLGQQTASQRAATREYLEGSSAGRSWARAAASALRPIAGSSLPDIPAEPKEVAEAFDALERRTARQEEVQRSSQLGTRLLFAGAGVVVAAVIILALSLGGGDDGSTAGGTTTAAPSATQTTPTGDRFEVVAQGTLAAPRGGDADAKGQVAIVHFPDNDQYRFALQATGLPASRTRGSAYGVWLYSSDDKKRFLGFPDRRVGKDGRLETVSDLSPDTPTYAAALLTLESAESPKKPGRIVLVGQLVTGAPRTQTQTQTTP